MNARYLPEATDLRGWERQVISECAELTQAITKAQQFGYAPTIDDQGRHYDNRAHVVAELKDLEHAVTKYIELLMLMPASVIIAKERHGY